MQAKYTRYQFLIDSVANHRDSEECLIWPYSRLPKGHGRVFSPITKKVVYAHEAAYSAFIKAGKHSLWNICGNTSCYHPRHWKSRQETNYEYLIRMIRGVPDSDKCIEWPFCRTPAGYGHLRVNGKDIIVSRLVFEITFGEIPQGLDVCHKCDNPPCFRPDHLFAGTPSHNMLDCSKKGRLKPGRSQGEKNRHAVLRANEVLEIRELFASGASVEEISNRYPIGKSGIKHIVMGRNWSHI